ncbi:hypothetical protein ANACOL_01714 [Anaerotruncus colihominis DSM 17241]|uniref:Uncharacterized protein n=1 Tax=Anaerotruncus colihominis DSM 17241 TaxID=445972 RepID=B0P9P6_9FIRM|nr:hypothetical protein ANACOL_01714 [Anaerotruncus colihominis DSM 17241]
MGVLGERLFAVLEPVFTAGGYWTGEGFCTRSRQIFAGGLSPGKKI